MRTMVHGERIVLSGYGAVVGLPTRAGATGSFRFWCPKCWEDDDRAHWIRVEFGPAQAAGVWELRGPAEAGRITLVPSIRCEPCGFHCHVTAGAAEILVP